MEGGDRDRRSGAERRKAARERRDRIRQLWSCCETLAELASAASPDKAIESARSLVAQDRSQGNMDAALLLSASALEGAIREILQGKLPGPGVETALGSIRSHTASQDFIDFTLKDLLGRALGREPVGRRAVPVRAWNAAMELLAARNALDRVGGVGLESLLGKDDPGKVRTLATWVQAASTVVERLKGLKPARTR